MHKLLLIALGGAVGTLARYGTHVLSRGLGERASFPIGTLIVNLLGCFVIGYTHGLLIDRVREEYRLAIVVGFLGGFTTFSTFAWDTAGLLRDGQTTRAMINVVASNALGIALVFVGHSLSRWRA